MADRGKEYKNTHGSIFVADARLLSFRHDLNNREDFDCKTEECDSM